MKLLTVSRAATEFGVTKKQLYYWARCHKAPHIRIHRGIFFRYEELSQWILGHAIRAN
jgi:transposase-like protein